MPTRISLGGIGVTIDLSNRDYYGFRQDLLDLIPTLTSEWTDFTPSDPGVVTLELFSAVADNNAFYTDRCANECYLATCSQRASALKKAREASYSPQPNISAVVAESVTVGGVGGETVPRGFSIGSVATQGQRQLRYELQADFVSPGPATYVLDFVEGETYSEVLGSSTGLADQKFTLTRAPVSHNPNGTSSLVVTVDEGIPAVWTEVDDFRTSTATDTHFVSRLNQFDRTEIQFGDGINGKIPAAGSNNISIEARIGGGIIGNQVGVNRITQILDSSPGIVTAVTNLTNPQGGENKETLAEMKVNIPQFTRANDRAVTDTDYAFFATQVSGVVSAKAIRGPSAYQMNIYCRVAGMDPRPSGTWNSVTETGTGLVGQVGTLVNTKKEGPVRLNVDGPYLVPPILDADVYVKDRYFQSDVQKAVERAVSAILNGYEIDIDGLSLGGEDDIPTVAPLPLGFPPNMGAPLRRSYLQQMVESITGVDYIDLNRLQRNPYARKVFGFNSDATFSEIRVGTDTKTESWILEFTSPTTFTMNGSTSGIQTATGTVGAPYTTDGGELSFTITAGSIPDSTGNRYEIISGVYLDTINAEALELISNFEPAGAPNPPSVTIRFHGGIV